MKNKFFLIMLIFGLILMTGCEKEKTDNGENLSPDVSSKDETLESETLVDQGEKLLTDTFKIPTLNIYVDVPSYNDIESGYTEIFKDGESKYITFNYFVDEVASTPKDVFEMAYPKFKVNVSSWHRINTEEFTSMEEVKINRITAQKVIGTVEFGMRNMTDCYLYGYSFIFESVPCAIIGVVSDKSQPQEEIDELTAIVDAMMKSVRTKP